MPRSLFAGARPERPSACRDSELHSSRREPNRRRTLDFHILRAVASQNSRRIIERPTCCIKAFGPGIFLPFSLDVAEYPLELVQAVVVHDELSLTGCGVLERDLGTQFIGQFSLQSANIRIHLRRPLRVGGMRIDDAA